jgi:acyl carrier protein
MIGIEQIRALIKKAGIKIDAEACPVNETFRDLGLDSLDVFNILLEIENHFNLKIPDDHIEHLQSIEAIQLYLNKLN